MNCGNKLRWSKGIVFNTQPETMCHHQAYKKRTEVYGFIRKGERVGRGRKMRIGAEGTKDMGH
jgi:hypothetical protein